MRNSTQRKNKEITSQLIIFKANFNVLNKPTTSTLPFIVAILKPENGSAFNLFFCNQPFFNEIMRSPSINEDYYILSHSRVRYFDGFVCSQPIQSSKSSSLCNIFQWSLVPLIVTSTFTIFL